MKKIQIEHKPLIEFLKSSKQHIKNIDKIMETKESYGRGKLIAKELNRFNIALDAFLHFECNVPINKLETILNKSFTIKK